MDFIVCYALFLFLNVAVAFYEYYLICFSAAQVAVARLSAVAMDVFLVWLYINENNFVCDLAVYLIGSLGLTDTGGPFYYGMKMAIAGPVIYILKLLICDYLVIPRLNARGFAVGRFEAGKLWMAYLSAVIFCFFFGFFYRAVF